MQVSLVTLPLRDNKAKLAMIVRSISLLEAKFSQVSGHHSHDSFVRTDARQEAMVKRIAKKVRLPTKSNAPLKRKVGYADEQLSASRARLEEMVISDEERNSRAA